MLARGPRHVIRRPLTAARLLIVGAVVGATLAVSRGPAAAYPHFQLTSGTDTCGACHVAPSGGGPLSEWGRGEVGDTLARGGDGGFLHGLVTLPAWLDVTGDLRLAALVNDTGDPGGAERALFPMQAELAVHAARGAWHLVVDAGVLGAIRRSEAMTGGGPAAPWLVSSAHYVMWRPAERGAYARVGKLAVPYGLRLADHTTYVRRQLGLGLYQEPYALSAGYLGGRWDVHVTALVADPWRGPPGREVGGAALIERRAGPWVVSGSALVTDAVDERRARLGAAAARWLAPASLYALAEVDGGWQRVPTVDRAQVTAYAGLAWLPTRGVVVGGAYQLDDVELGRAGDTRHALDLWSTFMPIAHVELGLSGRYQWIGPGARAAMALLQVHYSL